ncbi:MAG: hypothetical protein VYC34_10045, partial [Planctomycetota bacterium]|nr:hypothetical protein [Planctomycetota bacterium]
MMNRTSVVFCLFSAAIAILWSGAAKAQDEQTAEQLQAELDALPPAVRLGAMAEGVRRRLPVLSTVVIVEDESSFVDAVGAWRIEQRFPVLIDDGSHEARENIARFVRAFQPENVLIWESDDQGRVTPERIEGAIAAAWNAEGYGSLKERWTSIGFKPHGVVVASMRDRAWPAALALGAGRGQPIAFIEHRPANPGGDLEGEALTAFVEQVDRGVADVCEAFGVSWKS